MINFWLNFKALRQILKSLGSLKSRVKHLFMWKIKNFCVDATSKSELEGYTRGWPMQTDCEREVVAELVKCGIVKD